MIFKCTIELIFVKRDLCSRYLAATKLENALSDPNKGLSNFNYLAHVQKITVEHGLVRFMVCYVSWFGTFHGLVRF